MRKGAVPVRTYSHQQNSVNTVVLKIIVNKMIPLGQIRFI